MDFQTIKFEEPEFGIGVIKLNRPDCLNALSMDMVEELHVLFGQLHNQERVRVIVITGEGRGFCSGADLKDQRAIRPELTSNLSGAPGTLLVIQKKYSGLIIWMRRLPQPIIAAVNGVAAGGGMCIALASDVIIASPEATFIASFINLGLSGGELGTTYFLPRLIGSVRTAEILMTGRPVDAIEAEKIGLVNRVVKKEALVDSAMETARIMISKNPIGLRLTKETLNQNVDATYLEAAIELESRNQTICSAPGSPDFIKAIEAFVHKRK
jgi:enoyl-CoA hydratase/carnithine racemase